MNLLESIDILQVLATIAFLVQLGALAVSDLQTLRLPLKANLLFAVSGVALSGFAFDVPMIERLIGFCAGFVSLQIIASSYKRVRGRHGLGGGDPILLGGIGAWTGWQALPMIVMLASLIGLMVSIVSLSRKVGNSHWAALRLPLGTFLAISAFVMVVSGERLLDFRLAELIR